MKSSFQMLKYGLFAGSALFALSGTAHADQAADATTAAATPSGEIIVTANRRDQSLQDVPMTLQALSSDSLSKLNVTTFNDLLKYTPNVTFGSNGPGQGAIFMRGLSAGFAGEQSSGTIGGFPNVALYLDDQSMQFPSHNADVYVADIERVEVLEGPQGTLFGGGAEAGAVRYITAKPKLDKFEGKIEGSFGGTSGGAANAAFNAMINVPIIQDKVAVRAVVYDDHHGGYINNVFSTFTRQNSDLGNYYLGLGGKTVPTTQQSNNGQYNNADQVKNNFNPVDYIGGRIELAANIAPDWNLLVTESYQTLNTSGTFATQSYSYDYAPLNGLSSTLFEPAYSKDTYWNTAWTIDGKIGDFKVLYTGAYMTRNIYQQADYTNYARAAYGIYYQCVGGYTGRGATPAYCYAPNSYWTAQDRTTHESHEFRVTTPEKSRIRAIVGAYYEVFKIQDDTNWAYGTIPGCDPNLTKAQNQAAGTVCMGTVGPLAGTTINIPGQLNSAVRFGEDTQRGYRQIAAYGSVDFDIVDTVTLTGGTRYYNYNEYESGSEYYTNGSCFQAPLCTNNAININLADQPNLKFHGFKSKGVLTWKPQPHTMFYALFSQGFRPGLFNRGPSERADDPVAPHAPQLLVPAAIKPDTLTNWEAGFKTDLFDRKVQLNFSSYYMVWQNVQTGFFNPASGFGNTAFGVTGPSYHIKGAEVQLVARPITGLSLQGSATYNDSKQSTAPCFIGNIPGTSSYGQCITGIYSGGKVNPVTSPFGNIGAVTPFSPHVQGNFRARYDWAGKAAFNWFVGGGVSYTGSMYNEPATYPSGDAADNVTTFAGPNGVVIPGTTVLRYKMPGYALVDSQVGFNHENVTFTVFVENLTNSHASTFTSSDEYIKTEVPVRPRIYGVKISSKF
jgi:outer membrane receptor protein involved in Fe transport